MLKTTGNSSKKDNLSMSNSFSTLNEEEKEDEEDVENVYDESANLIQNTKAGGSSSFTAAAVGNLAVTSFGKGENIQLLHDFDQLFTREAGVQVTILSKPGFQFIRSWTFELASQIPRVGYLKHLGYEVKYVRNFTDIDDKVPDIQKKDEKSSKNGPKPSNGMEKRRGCYNEDPRKYSESIDQEKDGNVNSINNVNAASTNKVNAVGGKTSTKLLDDPNMPALEDISIFDLLRDNEDVGAQADMNNLDTTIQVSPIPTTRIHKDHPLNQVIGDLQSSTQTRNMSKNLEEHGKRAIGTKWVFKNKKDERGIVIRNKARLVAQGYAQEEGIAYDEVFAPIARIEAISLFLAYASDRRKIGALRAWYETLSTYLLDNEFQRGKIDKTLFIKRYKGDILLVQVYVDDIIFGSTKKELCNAFEKLMHEKFQMSSMGELTFFLGLQVHQKKDGIFISQGKYVGDILKKFRSMIGSLMYLTSSRPNIMFAMCACARYQVNPKVSHIHDVKRIFRYLKGQPKLGLWYPKDSPFDLVAYTNSDYARARLDRNSTT
ncbi:putative ribonuclease H-like domain-containing protein [Tanacetum coccineum]